MMPQVTGTPIPVRNRILGLLRPPDYERLLPHLETVRLKQGETIFKGGDILTSVYFPDSGLVSHAADVGGGVVAEAGMVGREGLLGLPALLGSGKAAFEAHVQVAGEARRMPAEVFRAEAESCSQLAQLSFRFLEAIIYHLGQSSACNSHHSVEQRCCRWLLLVRDRLEEDEFPLTQQYLADMLGVRRQGVTEVAGNLQRRGLIRYRRGSVHIVDRPGLEQQACHCYRAIRERYDGLFPAVL